MNKKVILLGVAFILGTINSTFAAKLSVQQCEILASTVNATTPKRVDEYTILKTSVCLGAGGQIEFRYVYEILGNLSVDKIPEGFKKNVKNSFCTNPDTSKLIEVVDKITYEYYYKKTGKYFDRFSFSEKDC